MDQLDQNLLGLLRLNAREPVASLARKLNTSRSTVQDRLGKLEQKGTIKGYTIDLTESSDETLIRSFITVLIEPQKTSMIVAELKTFHQINAIHSVSGKFDLMIEISVSHTGEIDRILDKICDIQGVLKTESSIVLSTKLKR